MRGPIVGELCVGNYDERTYCRREIMMRGPIVGKL